MPRGRGGGMIDSDSPASQGILPVHPEDIARLSIAGPGVEDDDQECRGRFWALQQSVAL
jgi:hypothetical protein